MVLRFIGERGYVMREQEVREEDLLVPKRNI